jgi:hypothetical protein
MFLTAHGYTPSEVEQIVLGATIPIDDEAHYDTEDANLDP